MHRTFACYRDVLVQLCWLQCLQTSQVMNASNAVRMNPEPRRIFCTALLSSYRIFEAAIVFEYAASQNSHQDLPFSLRKSLS